MIELAFQRGERAGQARHGFVRMAQRGRNAFAGIAERCKYLRALARAGSNVRLQLGARGGVERVGPLAGGKLNVGNMRLHAAVFLGLRAQRFKFCLHFLHLALMFGLLRLAQALVLLLRVICLPRGFLQLCAQLGDRLLRGGQPFFERVLRAGRGGGGFGELVALALGLGELCAKVCILAAETVALLFERLDLLLALKRGSFNITDDVIAVKAAEDGTLEGIFHDAPTFFFFKHIVTQKAGDDKEKSAAPVRAPRVRAI